MNRATVTPLVARCAVCLDTGSTEKQVDGYQDCRYCDATERKKALIAAYKKERWNFHLGEEDMIWAAYLFAQRQAPVAVQPALPKLPSTPEEVVAFIGDHFEIMGIEGPMEDRRITLTVHDLLSAFQAYEDAQPAVVAAPERCTDPDACDAQGCCNPLGRCEEAAPAIAAPVEVELDAGLDALKALVDHLADGDVEGLIEHSEPMIAARKALVGYNPVAQCTNSDSWNCKYCRISNCEALKDPRNFGKPIAAIDAAIATGDKHE